MMAPDFTILEFNAEALRMENRSREDIVGRTHWDVYPGSEGTKLGQLYKKAMAERVPVALEHNYMWEDGHDRWLDMRAYPTADGNLAVFWRDITDRKLAEAALRESEVRHRYLIGSLAQAIWETDADGVVVADSPTWRSYTGQPLDEWLGYGWSNAVHPDDRAYAERQWREAVSVRGLVDAEFRLRAPDGCWRWTNVRATPLRDEAGNVEKWVGMNIDIDTRRRAEDTIHEREEVNAFLVRFSDAVRGLSDPDSVAETACHMVLEKLGVERAYWAEIDWDRRGYVVSSEAHISGVSVITGRC